MALVALDDCNTPVIIIYELVEPTVVVEKLPVEVCEALTLTQIEVIGIVILQMAFNLYKINSFEGRNEFLSRDGCKAYTYSIPKLQTRALLWQKFSCAYDWTGRCSLN